MFFRILKKDFKRKKVMNLILLLFVILAAMFLSSSVPNLLTVLNAVDNYMEKANISDYFIIERVNEVSREKEIKDYLENQQLVEDYEAVPGVLVNSSNLKVVSRQDPEVSGTQYETSTTSSLFAEHQEYLKVFDENGNDMNLQPGEIAIMGAEAEKNHLQPGDVLKLTVGDIEKTLVVAHITKDAAFGKSMMGFGRFVLCRDDFLDFYEEKEAMQIELYNVATPDIELFDADFGMHDFSIVFSGKRDLVKTCYMMDMLVAGILIIVSVCLIMIAFLILRFTIVFTILEDYQEIGAMKAIGVRERGIRGIYLTKYVAIAAVGSTIGFLFGFPFGKLMLNYAVSDLFIDGTGKYLLMRIISTIFVVLLVVVFCYTSTGKLKKVSAIEAIREGGTGERFRGKNLMHLYKSRRVPTAVFLACNDITGNFRSFLVLAVTFTLGMLLILLPLSAIQTLKSDHIVGLFSVAPSAAYLVSENMEQYSGAQGKTLLDEDIDRIEDKMEKSGAPVKVWAELGYYINYYKEDETKISRIYTFQSYHYGGDNYDLLEGSLPENEEEVALTEICAEELDVKVGDILHVQVEDEDREVMLTGIFQSMNMMGKLARVGEDFHATSLNPGVYALQVDFLGNQTTEKYYELLREKFPDVKVKNSQEFVNSMAGDVLDQLDTFKIAIICIVIMINSLITLLMVKAFMTKERKEIAVLKSIGYKDRVLKQWQTIRIVIVLAASIVLAVLLTKVLAPVTFGQIFKMVGATRIRMECNPLETYLIYPLLLFGVTGIAAYLAAGAVKHVDVKEMNN